MTRALRPLGQAAMSKARLSISSLMKLLRPLRDLEIHRCFGFTIGSTYWSSWGESSAAQQADAADEVRDGERPARPSQLIRGVRRARRTTCTQGPLPRCD